MELKCPKCGAEIPLGKKFCGECGHDLTLSSKSIPKEFFFEEKLARIQRYLPQDLTQKILAQRDKIEGERKQVTVMFCDMEGFTSLTEKIGSEQMYSIMDEVYAILIHKVHDYGGTVNELTGDGIMALFGAPIALEDAPQRAIRSALSIHREMSRFSDKIKHESGKPQIRMRIGIHTGSVVVGTLGNDLKVEFKAVGDTVNLASRLQNLAEAGTTYVTGETFKLAEGLFRFESLGERKVKGKEEPLTVYQVIAPSSRRTRFDVSAERGLTPFVGRGRELELLLDGLERARLGRGQAFSIIGEAGVGKSRLLYEFRKAVANEDVNFLEGRCLSYGRGIAYHPIIDILKSSFDIQDVDGDTKVKERVQDGLKVLKIDSSLTIPFILELLSVKESGVDHMAMGPEEKKDHIVESLNQVILKGSEIHPVIMAIEDLHWADRSTEDVLKFLLESIPGARVLLIFTYRPEFVHTWGARSFHNQLTLNRLSNRESLAMLTHFLGGEAVDKELEEVVLQKTEGIPFFIEEFVKSLKELKMIERKEAGYYLSKKVNASAIPSSIQAVITSRVDLLPESAKEVLQCGAVIDREFSYELIKELVPFPEKELLSHLSVLKDSELLYERGIFPQSTYIFKHALTREVVYDSILDRKKKMLHDQVGQAIEKLYADKIDEHYGILGEHFIAGKNFQRGADYFHEAARQARRAGSYKEAIDHAQKRLLCLEGLPQTPANQQKIIETRCSLGNYFSSLNWHVNARDVIAPIFDPALQLNDQKILAGIYFAMGAYYFWVEEDSNKSVEYLRKAIAASEEARELFYRWTSNYFLGILLTWNCEFEKGEKYFGEGLRINEQARNVGGIAYVKGTMSAHNHNFKGRVDLAYELSQQALQLANESGNNHNKGMGYASYGTSCYFKGLLKEAESSLIQAVSYCERTAHNSWHFWSAFLLGIIYSDLGEYDRSLKYHQESLSISERYQSVPSMGRIQKLCLERLKVFQGDRNIPLDELKSKYLEKNRLKMFEGTIARIIGEICLRIGDQHIREAEDWALKAIEIDKKNGTLWSLAADHAFYSEIFKRKGDGLNARENLVKAIEIFKKCGADGWVEKYEKELASL